MIQFLDSSSSIIAEQQIALPIWANQHRLFKKPRCSLQIVSAFNDVITKAIEAKEVPLPDFPVLFCTRKGGFRIRKVSVSQIDLDFAKAHKLSTQIIEDILKEEPDTLIADLSANWQAFEARRLNAMKDMLPVMNRYLELISQEREAERATHLPVLFSALRTCIKDQKKLYEQDDTRKMQATEGEELHEIRFHEKIADVKRARASAKEQFPQIILPEICDALLSEDELKDPLSIAVTYFDQETAKNILLAQYDNNVLWDPLREAFPEAYFEVLCSELRSYSSFDEVPQSLWTALYESPYINIDDLLGNSGFEISSEMCSQIVLKCRKLRTLKLGRNAPRAFLDTHFTQLITKHHSTLVKLELDGSSICDDHLTNLSSRQLKEISLQNTEITGEC